MFSKLFLAAPKVLLLQCPCACQSCFLQMMVILAFSLLSSLFMTALFLVSLMSWRSSESPNIRVRMFQHPSSRAGLFCRILLLLSGVIVYNLQFGCLLVSMHPMKKADCGGTTLSFSGVISLGYKPLTFYNVSPLKPFTKMYKSRVNKQQFIVKVTHVHGIIHYTLVFVHWRLVFHLYLLA